MLPSVHRAAHHTCGPLAKDTEAIRQIRRWICNQEVTCFPVRATLCNDCGQVDFFGEQWCSLLLNYFDLLFLLRCKFLVFKLLWWYMAPFRVKISMWSWLSLLCCAKLSVWVLFATEMFLLQMGKSFIYFLQNLEFILLCRIHKPVYMVTFSALHRYQSCKQYWESLLGMFYLQFLRDRSS